MFIFILIGALISSWIAAGVIPSLMVFGFHLISVKWFLPSVFLVCTIVGTAIGSAFTVISTIGIAFMGMGVTMGINPAMVAGAIISGQFSGIKHRRYRIQLIWHQLWLVRICLAIFET